MNPRPEQDDTVEVVIDRVDKVYPGGVTALRGVSLRIGRGMFGLLGPNGAGKTTLMRLVAALERPTRGEVTVNGIPVTRRPSWVRGLLGYLPQDFRAYDKLTPCEFLDYVALLKGLDDPRRRRREIELLLEQVGLGRSIRSRIGTFSGGMRQRLGIAQALLGGPPLLIVDEPTAGLDPEERIRFRNLLAELGLTRTIILSTHVVADVEHSCSELALLIGGRVAFRGTPDALISRAVGKVWEVEVDPGEADRVRATHRVVSSRAASGGGLALRVVGRDAPPGGARPVRPTLEDAYMVLVGEAVGFGK
ncbi:MAG TPA: ABC transporter ATP-binding protein [Clostridiales bacterium]|nr:ABC transporter ATP-binding protein [Clostridiales bacterium]